MSAVQRANPRQLYRMLLSVGRKYPDYNIRHYILRRTKTEFRKNAGLTGEEATAKLQEGVETLRVIERQQAIAAMYASEKSIMETAGRIV